jgi:predicted phage terminase large subunit-like protein
LSTAAVEAVAASVASLEEEYAQLSRQGLLAFTKYTKPDYEINWHHRIVAQKLDDVLAGKIRRLMIFEPPQHGKSEQVSRRFPAFALGRNPNLRIIGWTYSDSLAQAMSRDVQKVMDTREYARLFPETRLAEGKDTEKRTQGQFEVVGGRGYYIGAGIMGSITGKTSDIGLIDDPIKNRAEAESEVYRERVWDQYVSAFATRQFGDKGAIIICLTRWHEDDLAGRLLQLAKDNPDADQWEVLSFSAIAEVDDGHRRIGDSLWPAKYPLAELRRRRAGMGEYDWAALYGQKPSPSGGGLFKEEWFAGKFVDAAPVVARRARGWDTAATEDGGDYTVGVKIAEASGIFYVEDVTRGQWTPGVAEQKMETQFELDGKLCAQREEQEGGAAGKSVIEAHIKKFAGVNFQGVPTTGSKVTRSKPFRIQCEAGNVRIVRDGGRGGVEGRGWNADYIKELCSFPTGKHDDQIDGSSAGFNAVLLEPEPFDPAAAGFTSQATW